MTVANHLPPNDYSLQVNDYNTTHERLHLLPNDYSTFRFFPSVKRSIGILQTPNYAEVCRSMPNFISHALDSAVADKEHTHLVPWGRG